MSIEQLEHTADIRVRVKASSLNELFSEAARALMQVMYREIHQGGMVRSIEITAEDTDTLMQEFLSELLFISEVEGMVISSADVRVFENRLSGEVRGEPFRAGVHGGGMEVKGISLYGLQIAHKEGSYMLDVIFDV